MPTLTQVLSPSQPDRAKLNKLVVIQRVLLGVVALIAVASLAAVLVPSLASMGPQGWLEMRADACIAELFCVLGLALAEHGRPRVMLVTSLILSVVLTVLATTVLVEAALRISIGIDPFAVASLRSGQPGDLSVCLAAAFGLLGLAIILIRIREGFAAHAADFFVSSLCLLVLIMVSGSFLIAISPLGGPAGNRIEPLTLLCLAFLAFVAITRRAEHGVFTILLGTGLGSVIARITAPIVLILPFVGEAARSRIVPANLVRAELGGAIGASLAAGAAFGIVVYSAWRMNRLDEKVRDLSLRDDVSGLYNNRGFHLLALQAMRQAHRSQMPFSLMFIDMDDLRQIKHSLGMATAASYMTEMAGLLKATFRDTDILGRIGGDQFVVAGHFSEKAVSVLVQRLQEVVNYRNSDPGWAYTIKFSVGYVTADPDLKETLDELIAKADKAVYRHKRRKELNLE
jgi:diguanylate cyclase (GGDEF)-like protein